jgi:enoyl-CoA hydratase/carnithine racemase
VSKLDDYATRFESIAFERSDGILEMRLHTNGGSLQWGGGPHVELEEALLLVARDHANEIVILTGTDRAFSGPEVTEAMGRAMPQLEGPEWMKVAWEARNTLLNLLDIQVPMIAAINGPALRHAEVPLLCDIVLATEDMVIQDSAHFRGNLVPGDGMHVVMPLLMGINRARYFLLTGQKMTAREALQAGLIHEILPHEDLLPRARELARLLLKQSKLTRRHTRILLTERIRQELNRFLSLGLALEGLGVVASA